MFEHIEAALVEAAGGVAAGGALELVGEAETIQKAAQHGVVVFAEAGMGAERIGDVGERLAEMAADHLAVRNIVGHFAQAVAIVREGEQAGLDAGRQQLEGAADHGGARHFAEGADMGQARRAVAGLEQDIAFRRRFPFEALVEQHLGFLERPSGGETGDSGEISGHRASVSVENEGNASYAT